MIKPSDLIGLNYTNPVDLAVFLETLKSQSYMAGIPYPKYNFGPSKGYPADAPIPTPTMYTRIVCQNIAQFTVKGGAPTFSVPDNPNANKFLQEVIKANFLDSLWVSTGIDLANSGTLLAKFNVDYEDTERPITISYLSVPTQARIYTDPHDHTRVLMIRVQYPYRDYARNNNWYIYREEWTAQEYVTYVPKLAGGSIISSMFELPGYRDTLGDDGIWQIETRDTNPYGLIPFVVLKNESVAGSALGRGQCWGTFEWQDRMALCLSGIDQYAQLSAEPVKVFKNAETDSIGRLAPGEPVIINNSDDGVEADFELKEPHGNARSQASWYLVKAENHFYETVGLSVLDAQAYANSGNLTAAGLRTLYERSITTAVTHRLLLGEMGMCILFEKLLTAVSNLGASKLLKGYDKSQAVLVDWPDFFTPLAADLSLYATAFATQISCGMKTAARAAEEMAKIEGQPASVVNTIVEEVNAAKLDDEPNNVADDTINTLGEITDGVGSFNV